MPPSVQTTRLTSTLRLLIPRLRLLQRKDTASSVIQRRELATLLDEGRESSARIRVENVIATDIAVEVMEMVELYCELLLTRVNVLDQLAFGEKGARARSRAKEALKAEMGAQKHGHGHTHPQDASSGGGDTASKSFLGFSFWAGGGSKKQTPNISESTPGRGRKTEAEEAADENDEEQTPSYIDAALDEAAAVIFYAWPRFPHDVRELTMLRGMLAERWGKEFMTLAQDNKLVDVRVPERLVKGLRVKPPAQELVESYLREIAKAYGSSWGAQAQSQSQSESELGEAPREFVGDRPGDTDQPGDGDGDGDAAVPSTPTRPVNMAEARRASETSELNKATPPRGFQSVKSPVSVAPPGPRSDNPNPRVKVPGSEIQSETQVEEPPRARNGNAGGSGGIPELDELARRFAALRR
ncbi:Vacuolar protein sorting-associated protein ist1 [Aspergillus fumigatus]